MSLTVSDTEGTGSTATVTKSLLPSQPLADLEHPWLGLESFREDTHAYFFGRDPEVGELHLRLRSHPLLVVYGRSGLGKTSILNAGLIPRLRAEGMRPALYRITYDGAQGGPSAQILSRLGASDQVAKFPFELPQDLASQMWVQVHRRDHPPSTTHLILDQFEEVFTLASARAESADEVRDALAILIQGFIPEPIARIINEHEKFLDYFDPDSIPIRVTLALRDDYLYALNRWRRHLPSLGQNSFELRPLRGPGALDAVFKPGELRCHYRSEVSEATKCETNLPPIINLEAAQRIVRFIAKKEKEVPIEEIEAVPPILSLLCHELNERRFAAPEGTRENPAEQVTFSEAAAAVEGIISSFYERCLAQRPEAVRIFIEEELVSYGGARLQQDQGSILMVFVDGCGVPGSDGRYANGFGNQADAYKCLEELVGQRLISPLGGDSPRYELSHDLLALVAQRSRSVREDRIVAEVSTQRAIAEAEEAKARAEKAEAAHIAAENARTRARLFAVIALLLAVTFSAIAYAIVAMRGSQLAIDQARIVTEQANVEKQNVELEAWKKTLDAREELLKKEDEVRELLQKAETSSELAKVVALADEKLKSHPKSYSLQLHRCIALGRIGKRTEQIQGYKALTAQEDLSPEERARAFVNLAIVFLAGDASDQAQAFDACMNAIKADVTYTATYAQLAKLRLSEDQLLKALESVERAIVSSPRDAQLYKHKSSILWNADRQSDAIVALTSGIAAEAEPTKALYLERAGLFANQGDTQRSLADFLSAIQSDSSDAKTYTAVSGRLKMLKPSPDQLQKMLEGLDGAIKSNSHDAELYKAKSGILWRIERKVEAVSTLDRGLTEKAEPMRVLFLEKGERLVKQGKVQEAQEAFDKAIESDPKDAETYTNAATALMAQSKRAEAIAILDRGIGAASDKSKLYGERGYIRSQAGDKTDIPTVISDFNEVRKVKPNDEGTYRLYGWALFNLDETADALAQWKKAQELAGVPSTDLLAGLSIGYWTNRQRNEAVEAFRNLVKRNANYKDEAFIRDLEWPEKETGALLELRAFANDK
jgi:tetratricopeptide (TPR) repeat protein